jgi:hypothetical protein
MVFPARHEIPDDKIVDVDDQVSPAQVDTAPAADQYV